MPVANAMRERHLALFNRYPIEPATNLLYAPPCGKSGNKAEFPRMKSAVRAGISGLGFSCCSRPIVGIVPPEIQGLAASMLYNTLCVFKVKVRAILACCGFVGRFSRMFAPVVRKEHSVVRLIKILHLQIW